MRRCNVGARNHRTDRGRALAIASLRLRRLRRCTDGKNCGDRTKEREDLRTRSTAFASALAAHQITTSGTRFLLDGRPFPCIELSFFNAIYNPVFNQNSDDRIRWLRKSQNYGLNVLRVWAQWDSKRGFVKACPVCSLYLPDGKLRMNNVERLKQILTDS
jgi:hypothetical protein